MATEGTLYRELDGDEDAALLGRARRWLSPAMRISFPEVVVAGGSGSRFWTRSGREFLDLHSMAAIMNLGYGHPKHTQAIHDQVDRMLHCNPAYVLSQPVLELAEQLASVAPGQKAKRVAFGLSGSDAIDGAIKLARAATGRQLIIAFEGAYHGNTYGALSLSSISSAMRRGFGPTVPGIFHVPYPRVRSTDPPEMVAQAVDDAFDHLEWLLDTVAPPTDVAAIFLEPIQGDSGVFVPPVAYVDRLAQLTHQYGILLVAEEVQSGIGRTGQMFAIERYEVEPDILVVGKALGGGVPISAIVARSDLMDAWSAPGHVFSTSASPVAAAAASTVLRVLVEEDLLQAAQSRGEQFRAGFKTIAGQWPLVRDIRGEGLMLGVELDAGDQAAGVAATRLLAAKVVKGCFDRGCFITFLAGSVLRIMPPLVIMTDEVDRALEVLEASLADAVQGKVPDDAVKHMGGW
jgi:4-aminobutyrate aminotransferase